MENNHDFTISFTDLFTGFPWRKYGYFMMTVCVIALIFGWMQ